MGCGPSQDDNVAANGKSLAKAPESGLAKALRRYVKLEQRIQEKEQDNPWEKIRTRTSRVVDLDRTIESKSSELRILQEITGQYNSDVRALDKELRDSAQQGENEKVEALTKQIMLVKEVDNLQGSRDLLAEEIKTLEADAEELQDLYSKQDAVLDGVFGGDYGSMKENQLEQEWEIFEKRREKGSEVRAKWIQARDAMVTAYVCLKAAAQFAADGQLDHEAEDRRTSDWRNNLATAASSFAAARRSLGRVKSTYCAEEIAESLQKAAADVYKEGHNSSYAAPFYEEMLKNAASFVLWAEEVLKERVNPFEESQIANAREKALALRRERIHLLRQRVQELGVDAKDTEVDPGVYEEYHGPGTGQITNPADDQLLVDRDELRGKAAEALGPLPTIDEILGVQGPRRSGAAEPAGKGGSAAAGAAGSRSAASQENTIISDSLREKLEMRRQRRSRMRTKSMFNVISSPDASSRAEAAPEE